MEIIEGVDRQLWKFYDTSAYEEHHLKIASLEHEHFCIYFYDVLIWIAHSFTREDK